MLTSPFKYMPPVGMRQGMGTILSALLASLKPCEMTFSPEIFGDAEHFSFDSGKAALLTALKAMAKIQGGRVNVVVPAYTCFSVAAVIEQAGLRMVLCDVLPETLDFDYTMLQEVVDENTLCIVSTHLFGKSADVEKARHYAEQFNTFVVEDAAQSLPELNTPASQADVVVYSFGRGKPYSVGGGGVLSCNRKDIASTIEQIIEYELNDAFSAQFMAAIKLLLNDLLLSPNIFWLPASMPFLKIGKTIYPDDVRVGGMIRLKKVLLNLVSEKYPKLSAERRQKTEYYHQAFASLAIPEKLIHLAKSDYCPIRYPFYVPNGLSNLSDNERRQLAKLGMVAMYPCGLHRVERAQSFFVNKQMSFPGADWISEHLLSLPVHPLIKEQDQLKVINSIKGLV